MRMIAVSWLLFVGILVLCAGPSFSLPNTSRILAGAPDLVTTLRHFRLAK